MLKLTKKFEYGLLAIQHVAALPPDATVTAKQIASDLGVSYELIAKVLQLMAKADLLQSVQGVRGGYRLNRPASHITLSQVAEAIEGKIQLIECDGGEVNCDGVLVCAIKKPLTKIQTKFRQIFNEATLADIL